MTIPRVLEPEVMDSREEAVDYNSMDHSTVNRAFVQELLEFARKVRPEGVSFEDQREGDYTLGDVLDPGTGTAQIPVELCKQDPFCRVMAVDMAESMLEIARYNVASFPDRIQLAKVDAKAMPYSAGMFDTLMSNSITHHLAEPVHCMKEMARVTVSGGVIFVRDLMRPDSEEQLEWIVKEYAGDENEHSQKMFRESLWAALNLDEIRSLVEEVGFEKETVTATSDRHWTWAARKP
ncbi:MAG: class I SAM-dependent methyltransferase [Planctomycetota bacterium]